MSNSNQDNSMKNCSKSKSTSSSHVSKKNNASKDNNNSKSSANEDRLKNAFNEAMHTTPIDIGEDRLSLFNYFINEISPHMWIPIERSDMTSREIQKLTTFEGDFYRLSGTDGNEVTKKIYLTVSNNYI